MLENVINGIEDLINKTNQEARDSNSGMTICRSSRYQGLDAEACFAKLRKMQATDKQLINQHEFHQVFDNLLIQLATDPRTSKEAIGLLMPVESSKRMLKQIVSREERLQAFTSKLCVWYLR